MKHKHIVIFGIFYLAIFASYTIINVCENNYIKENFNIESGDRIWFTDYQKLGDFTRVPIEEKIVSSRIGESALVHGIPISLMRAWNKIYVMIGDEVQIVPDKDEEKIIEINGKVYIVHWKQENDEYSISQYKEYYYIEVDGWAPEFFNCNTSNNIIKRLISVALRRNYCYGLSEKQDKFYIFIFQPESENELTSIFSIKGNIENIIEARSPSETSKKEITEIANLIDGSYIGKAHFTYQCDPYNTNCVFMLKASDNGLIIESRKSDYYIIPEFNMPVAYAIAKFLLKVIFVISIVGNFLFCLICLLNRDDKDNIKEDDNEEEER